MAERIQALSERKYLGVTVVTIVTIVNVVNIVNTVFRKPGSFFKFFR